MENLTLKELREVASLFNNKTSNKSLNCKVGKKYVILTVGFFWVGIVEEIHSDCMVLKQASWVADMGRFNKAMKLGFQSAISSEIEPLDTNDRINVNFDSIMATIEWKHELPTEVIE